MAIFKTGTATGPTQLIDQVVAELIAAGWTNAHTAADGTGFRYHLAKNSLYANLRTAGAEAGVFYNISGQFSGVALNVSTGFSAASAWREQAGAASDTAQAGKQAACIVIPPGTALSWWLITDDADNVVLVTQSPGAIIQYLGWGPSIAKATAFTGGAYFFATHRAGPWTAVDANYRPTQNIYSTYVRADVDTFTGRWVCNGNTDTYSVNSTGWNCTTTSQDNASVPNYATLRSRLVSKLTGQANLLPIRMYAARAGGGWSLLGDIPTMFECGAVGNGFGQGTLYTIGADKYVLFNGFAVKGGA